MKKLRNYEITKLFLILILLLAVFLRFYRLADNPPSLNWDEVSHGYNAYSILKTGRDEWGVKWPMIFRAYGDYKLPVYIYLTAASVKLFGLSELAVRIPSAFFGFLGVLGVFGLVKELFANSVYPKGVPALLAGRHSAFARRSRGFGRQSRATLRVSLGLIAAFLLAVEPWGLFLSRVAVEANVALFLIIAGTYFFLRGLKSSWFLVFSSLFFGLSLFTYNSARVFVPLLVGSLVWIYKGNREDKGNREVKILAGGVFLIFLAGMLISFFSPSGQARFKWISLLDEGAIQKINQVRSQSSLPGVLPLVFYNKGTYLAFQFSKNYLAHFSPGFLFFKGGSHYQFNVPDFSLLYPVNIPFVLIGFWYLVKEGKQPSKVVLAWLFLSPIASSVTRDSPHTLRAIVMLPMWQTLAAVGLVWVFAGFRNKKLQLGFILIYLLSIIFYLLSFLRIYFGPYRTNYSWAWQYGYKQTLEFVKENYDQYDKIIVTKKYGEPHEFILFYWPWDPKKYREDQKLVRYFRTNWYWVDGFDKFEFINDWEIQESYKVTKLQSDKALLVTSPGNYPEGWRLIETIDFLDGEPAFEILKN